VVDPDICAAWIYDYIPMIVIYKWDKVAVLELELKVLCRGSLGVASTRY